MKSDATLGQHPSNPPRWRRVTLATALGLVAGVLAMVGVPSVSPFTNRAAAAAEPVLPTPLEPTLNIAAGPYSTVVPAGACGVVATVRGGDGGVALTNVQIPHTNGRGAVIEARFRVVPGQVIEGFVGGGGRGNGVAGVNGGGAGGVGGHPGGGGGGWSNLTLGHEEFIVAGGGGGSGGGHRSDRGHGGDAGLPNLSSVDEGPAVAAGESGRHGWDRFGDEFGADGAPGPGEGGQANRAGAGGVHAHPDHGYLGFPVNPHTNPVGLNGHSGGTVDGFELAESESDARHGGNGSRDAGLDTGGGGGGGWFGAGGGASTHGDGGGMGGAGGGGGSSWVRGAIADAPDSSTTMVEFLGADHGPGRNRVGHGDDGSVAFDWIPCDYALDVDKSVTPNSADPGTTVTWSATITNSGPDSMTQGDLVYLSDPQIGDTPRVITSISTSGGSGHDLFTSGTELACHTGGADPESVGVGDELPEEIWCARPYDATAAVDGVAEGERGLDVGESITITYEQVMAMTGQITNMASTVDRRGVSEAEASVDVFAKPVLARECSPPVQRAQERWWHFGNRVVMDFGATGDDAPTASRNDTNLSVLEGTTVVTDDSGQLLFWVGDNRIYNRDQQLMQNGTLTVRNDTVQPHAAFAAPGEPDQFFVISNTGNWGDTRGGRLFWSRVDLTENGGLGAVVPAERNVALPGPEGSVNNYSTEALVAIPNNDGTKVWVLTFKPRDSRILAYEFDGNGPTGKLVESEMPEDNRYGTGSLKYHEKRGQLVMVTNEAVPTLATDVRLLDFDARTGQAFNRYDWSVDSYRSNLGYMAEFSPSGDYVYVTAGTRASGYSDSPQVLRYKIGGATTSAEIAASEEIHSIAGAGNGGGGITRAPDGRLFYVARYNVESLGVIEDPDSETPTYLDTGFQLPTGTRVYWGLPTTLVGCTPAAPPALDLVKTAALDGGQDEASVGDTVTYTFTVTNRGGSPIDGVTVTDPLPGLSELSPTEPQMLGLGESVDFTATYVVTQADVDRGSIDNTASANGTDGDGEPVVSNESDASVPTAPLEPALDLVKAADLDDENGNGRADAGEVITYTFTVTNTGNVTARDVAVADPLPGLSPISPSRAASVAPGGSTVFTATYVVQQDDADAGEILNTATASGTDPDGEPIGSDPADAVIEIPQETGLSLLKEAFLDDVNDGGGANDGEVITYLFTVTNTGNVSLADVSVDDPMPGLVIQEPSTIAVLDPGASAELIGIYTVTAADEDAGGVDNTATAVGVGPDEASVESDPASASVPGERPSLRLEKSASLGDTNDDGVADDGEVVTYTFTVTNNGNVRLADVVVEDPLPGLSATDPVSVDELEPGDSIEFTATYTVKQADVDAGGVDNTATAQGATPDEEPVDSNESSASIPTGDPVATLALAKVGVLDDANGDGDGNVGEVITYTFTVTNTGNVTVTDVAVDDPLVGLSAFTPATVSTLAPGASTEFAATYALTQDDLDAGGVDNTATAGGTDPDGGPVGALPADNRVPVAPASALGLTKAADLDDTDEDGQISADEVVTYTFTVTNTGGLTVSDVSVTDPLAGLSEISPASVPSLAPGESADFTATYTITQADVDGGGITNTAAATGSAPNGDEVPSNEASAVLTVDAAPRIDLDKAATLADSNGDGGASVDEVVTYTFTVTNTGNVTVTDVAVDDPLDGLSEIAPVSVPSLIPGESAVFTATYTVTQADVDAGGVDNVATAGAVGPDGSPFLSEPAEASVATPNPAPSLALVKTAELDDVNGDEGASLGETITYRFTATNTGGLTLSDVSVDDLLGGLSVMDPVSVASLAPGESADFTATYAVTQADVDAGGVLNTASAAASAPNGDPVVSAPDSAEVLSLQSPELFLVKSATVDDDATGRAGEEIVYTFEVTNTGNLTVSDVSVVDPLPGLSAITPALVDLLVPGESVVFTATYSVTQADVDAGGVDNTAEASGEAPDGEPVVSDEASASVPTLPVPLLALVKTAVLDDVDGDGAASVGEEIAYRFEVTNTGNVTVSDVSIDDPMLTDAGVDITCPSTDLAPGESVRCEAIYTVSDRDVGAEQIVNVATALGQSPDGESVLSGEAEAIVPGPLDPPPPPESTTTTTDPAPPTDPAADPPAGPLPRTGSDTRSVVVAALALLLAGVGIQMGRSRSRGREVQR